MTGHLTDDDRNELGKRAARLGVLVKAPDRSGRRCAGHCQALPGESNFAARLRAQVVTLDREACLLYKQELDKHLPPEASTVVMTVQPTKRITKHLPVTPTRRRICWRSSSRMPTDPLKILIVTSRLLTGFDAPILQAMYLDKPIKEHSLLQAVCRTNRPYPTKSHGLIVDYIGVFDDVAAALMFDEKSVLKAVGRAGPTACGGVPVRSRIASTSSPASTAPSAGTKA